MAEEVPVVSAPAPSGSLSAAHVIAGSSLVGIIATIIAWATHWPLQPPSPETCEAMASLGVSFFGGGGVMIFRKKN